MNETKNNNYIDTVYLAVGEGVVAALICAVYLIIGRFDYTVLTGALLGGGVTVLNFLLLSYSVNKAVNRYIGERGSREMSDEEAEKFAADHKMDIQNAMTKSYILRNALMLGSILLAILTKQFDLVAILVPLVMYKPIIYLTELIKKKRGE